MTHTSKTDWWILAAIALGVVVLLVSRNYWVAGPVLLILVLCAYPQSYQTTPHGLVVRAALVRQLIPYQAISYVGAGDERHDDSAFSGGRIKIRYGLASEVVVTPANRDAFLRDLAAHTPHLTRLGRKLVAAYA